MTDRDRDQRETLRPPPGVRDQIAEPLKKPRAATPVHGIDFDEPTNVGLAPVLRKETPLQRMERHGAENKNLSIAQLDEITRLRERNDEIWNMLVQQHTKDRDARRYIVVKIGLAVAALIAGAAALLHGCG